MKKDWTGNKAAVFAIIGASNHSSSERQEHDYYATDPEALPPLLDYLVDNGLLRTVVGKKVWECACGEGHLSKKMEEKGMIVKSSDLILRGYGQSGVDFLKTTHADCGDNMIITNPPYKIAQEFVEHSLKITNTGTLTCMLLKLTFLEGQKRKKLFDKYPPLKVLVFSARQKCAINGDFENIGSSAICYAWFVWMKGFTGSPQIDWLNKETPHKRLL